MLKRTSENVVIDTDLLSNEKPAGMYRPLRISTYELDFGHTRAGAKVSTNSPFEKITSHTRQGASGTPVWFTLAKGT